MDPALATLLQAQQDFVLDLHVPGEIIFAGLQHRTRGRDGIAAALEFKAVEMGLVGHVVVRVDHAREQIARLEFLEEVRAGADRGEVGRRFAGLGAGEILEQMLGDDHAGDADESLGPERLGDIEHHLDGERVDFLDLDVLVGTGTDGRSGGVTGVFPVEHHIIGGERLAVVPLDALLELPGDGFAVGREAAVFPGRDFGGKNRDHVAVRIPAGEGFVEHPRAVLVLGAGGEMRVQQGGALPPQHLERPAAAALGRLVAGLRLGLGRAADGEQLGRQRRREADRCHTAHEAAAGQLPATDLADQSFEFTLVHRYPLGLCCRRAPDQLCASVNSYMPP